MYSRRWEAGDSKRVAGLAIPLPTLPQPQSIASKPETHRKGPRTRNNTGLLFAPEPGCCVVLECRAFPEPPRNASLRATGCLCEVRLQHMPLQVSSVQKAQLPATGAWGQQIPLLENGIHLPCLVAFHKVLVKILHLEIRKTDEAKVSYYRMKCQSSNYCLNK